MATEQEVRDFIFANYNVKDEGGGAMSMQIDIGNGRQHKVFAGLHAEALQVTAPVAWANQVDAERVLAANPSMFGIVEISGAYALKHNAFIEDLDESEILRAFVVLAIKADEFEAQLGFQDEF